MDDSSNSAAPEKINEKETRCGFLGWYPGWLQLLASKKTYVVVYGLIGMGHFTMSSYFTGTLTTIEKRFKIPSQTTGLISSTFDIGYIVVILCSYLGGQSHKSRWVAYGGIVITIGCFIRVVPHILYGAGQDAINLTYLNVSSLSNSTATGTSKDPSICGSLNINEDCSGGDSNSLMPTAILMLSQLVLGIGESSYWSLGVAYMDDNARKDKMAVLVSATAFIRMLGPTIGFYLASYSLEKFVDPSLKPTIGINDPRWVGAWWLAWIPLGIVNFVLCIMMAFFPKTLPRAAMRQNQLTVQPERKQKSIKGINTEIMALTVH